MAAAAGPNNMTASGNGQTVASSEQQVFDLGGGGGSRE